MQAALSQPHISQQFASQIPTVAGNQDTCQQEQASCLLPLTGSNPQNQLANCLGTLVCERHPGRRQQLCSEAAPACKQPCPAPYVYNGTKAFTCDEKDEDSVVAAAIKSKIAADNGLSEEDITVTRQDGLAWPAKDGDSNDAFAYNVTVKESASYVDGTYAVTGITVTNKEHKIKPIITEVTGAVTEISNATADADGNIDKGTYDIVVKPDWDNKYYVTGLTVQRNDEEAVTYTDGTYGKNGIFTVNVDLKVDDTTAVDTYTITPVIEHRDFTAKENVTLAYNFLGEESADSFKERVLKAVIDPNVDVDLYTIEYADFAKDQKEVVVPITITLKGTEQKPAVTKTVNVTLTHEKQAFVIDTTTVPTTKEVDGSYAGLINAIKNAIAEQNGVEADRITVTTESALPKQGEPVEAVFTVTIAENDWYKEASETVTVSVTGKVHPATVNMTQTGEGTVTVEQGETTIESGKAYYAGDLLITAEPGTNYYVDSITVNGDAIDMTQVENSVNFTAEYTIADGTNQEADAEDLVYDIHVTFAERPFTTKENPEAIGFNPTTEITDEYVAEIEAAVFEAIIGTDNEAGLTAEDVEIKFYYEGILGEIAASYHSLNEDLTIPVIGTVITENYYFKQGFATERTELGTVKDTEKFEVTLKTDGKYPAVTKYVDLGITDSRAIPAIKDAGYTYETVNTATVESWVKEKYALPEGISADEVTITQNADTPLPTDFNTPTAVKYDVVFEGNATYQPAAATITVTVTKLNPTCTVEIGTNDAEKGTVTVNGEAAAEEAIAVDDGAVVAVAVTPVSGQSVKSITVKAGEEAVETSAIKYNAGVATVTFTADGSNGGVTYTVNVEYTDAAFVFKDTREIKFMPGRELPTTEELYKAVVESPEYSKDADIKITYLAREAGTYTIDIPELAAYGITIYEGGEYTFDLNELWLEPGTTIEEVDLYKEINDLEAMFANINSLADAKAVAEYAEKFFASLPNKHIGAHEFGAVGDGNVEQLKISYKDNQYIIGETETDVTIKDPRTATEIAGHDATVTYGFTEAELKEAMGLAVTAGGTDIGGTIEFVNKVEGLDASETPYVLTVKFAGDANYQPSTATFNVTVNKAPCSIDFDSQVVTWGEDYDFSLVKNPEDVDTINFMIGLDLEALTTDNTMPNAYMQIQLPGVLGSFFEKETTLSEFIKVLETLSESSDSVLTALNIDREIVDALTTAMNSLAAEMGSYGEMKIKINGDELKPDNIGIYLAGAVTADSNYETAYTVDYLIVKPAATEATLKYNFEDENGIICSNLIQDGIYDLGATAYVEDEANEEATKEVQHLFLKLDTEGNIELSHVASNDALDKDLLSQTGAYTQMSYVLNWGNELFYAEPIVRAYAVVPELVNVQFVDENGEANNDRQFTYDGQPKALAVKVTSNQGDAIEDDNLTVTYRGYSLNNPKEIYNSTEAPVDAGAYTVTAVYADKENGAYGMDVAAMVIKPADVSIDVADRSVVYTGSGVDNGVTVDPEDCKYITMVAGVDASGDFVADGINAVSGAANIDFPARIDNVLKTIVPKAYEGGISVNEVIQNTEKVAAALEKAGFDAEAIDVIVNFIEQLPQTLLGNTKVTFLDWEEAAPVNTGMYIIGAVTCDPNYKLAADYGYLAIVPNVQEAELSFNMTDDNGFITNRIIENGTFDFGATATVKGEYNEEASSFVNYLFIGVDKNGNLVKSTTASAELGVYTQVAYMADTTANELYYAAPISRTYAVVAEQADVQFENNDGLRKFTYSGEAHAMTATAYGMDGEELNADNLTIRYIGYDANEIEIYNSTEAPVNAGTYTVLATYADTEKDVYGMNIGQMVILPAKADIDVESYFGPYSDDFRFADQITATAGDSVVTEDTPAYVAIVRGIEGEGYLSVEGIDFVNGVVVMDFPDRVDKYLQKLVPALYEGEGIDLVDLSIHKAGIQKALELAGMDADVIDQILAEAAAAEEAGDLKVRIAELEDVNPVNIGTYLLTAVGCDPNFLTAVGAGIISIYPENPAFEILYNQNIPESGVLELDQAEAFDFGAYIFDKDNNKEDTEYQIKHLYYGTTEDGKAYLSETAPTQLGTYTQISLPLDLSNNVYIMGAARSFTIERITTAITADMEGGQYNGEAYEISNIKVTDREGNALDNEYTVTYTGTRADGEAYESIEAPTEAGNYTVTVQVPQTDRYKAAEFTADFTIAQREIVVTIANVEKCVDIKDPEFTAAITKGSLVGDDQLTYDLTREAGEAVNKEYKIFAENVAVSYNYNVTFADGQLAIVPHNYKSVVVPPTCEDHGYTEHTCNVCGYVMYDTKVDPLKHSWDDGVVTKQPTCTADGVMTFTCTACGETKTETIAALGHQNVINMPEIPATCTKDGQTAWSYCTVCKLIVVEPATIPALDHDYKAVETAPTCTKAGYTTYTCDRCHDSYVVNGEDAAGHQWNDATCTTPATCKVCGETKGNALGHSWNDGVVTKQPTCTEDGVKTFTCGACGETKTEAIKATGHTHAEEWSRDADNHWHECACGDKADVAEHDFQWIIDKNATEDEAGAQHQECTVCGAKGAEEEIAKLTHTHNLIKTEAVTATCTEAGNIEYYTCSKCGKLYKDAEGKTEITAKDTVIEATGHQNVINFPEIPATCVTSGTEAWAYCTVCRDFVGGVPQEIPATGHSYEAWTSDAVNHWHVCDCGVIEDKAAHDWDAGVKANGTITYTCQTCAYVKTEKMSADQQLAGDLGLTEEGAKEILDFANKNGISEEVLKITDESITSSKSEDIAGASFGILSARASKATSNKVTLKWNKVKGADGYIIYGNKCGIGNKYKKLKTTTKTTWTQKKLKKGKSYKYFVIAYKVVDGKKITIAASKTIHTYTKTAKYGNAKAVKVNKTKVTLKKGKSFQLKAKEVKDAKKLKLHRKMAYETTNAKVATVTKKGKIKAVGKGTCYIYAYAHNGVYKKIKVTVK